MKCFNHRESEAVGACQGCGKALCHECCGDKKHIACDNCESKVVSVNKLLITLQKFPFGLLKIILITYVLSFVAGLVLFIIILSTVPQAIFKSDRPNYQQILDDYEKNEKQKKK